MVEIGGRPILWHIMMVYAAHGFRNFLLACGYKGEMIKQYFASFPVHSADYFVNTGDGSRELINGTGVDWRVGLIDTGLETMTGGRIERLKPWLGQGTLMVTYGDGLIDLDIGRLLEFHRAHGRLATVTAVRPPARFGSLLLEGDRVSEFSEKAQAAAGWINGGFFVFEPAVLDYLSGPDCILEREPMERLAAAGELMAFRHYGFWHPMDTLRDREYLQDLWSQGNAPWKVWP
jgi:glucose-1-phosphate cytidylyltransferase